MKTYTELLNTPQWRKRRLEVLELAKWKCNDCGCCQAGYECDCEVHDMDPGRLQVHHKYYVRGRKPWEYPDDALESLCDECHEQRTLLNDVLKLAMGVLTWRKQEVLLNHAKTLLVRQCETDPDVTIPYKDFPSELVEYLYLGKYRAFFPESNEVKSMKVVFDKDGFPSVNHGTRADPRVLSQSRRIDDVPGGYERPGSSFLYVGHFELNRKEVVEVIAHMKSWLETGRFVGQND